MSPLYFSVVLPAYNTPSDILRRAIDSVLNQTYPYFELIIVDDGSTPSLEPIVKEYTDKRIVFIRHPQNRGAGAAHNAGIKAAKYDWIAFICHDDEWLPNKLEVTCFNILYQNGTKYGLLFHNINIIGENSEKSHYNYVSPFTGNYFDYFKKNGVGIIQMSSAIFNKESFHKVGLFDEKFITLFDCDIFFRLSSKYDFLYINEKLSNYYLSFIGITNPDNLFSENMIYDFIAFVKKHRNCMNYKERIFWCIKLNSFVNYFKKRKNYKLMIKFLFTSLITLPFNLSNLKDIILNVIK